MTSKAIEMSAPCFAQRRSTPPSALGRADPTRLLCVRVLDSTGLLLTTVTSCIRRLHSTRVVFLRSGCRPLCSSQQSNGWVSGDLQHSATCDPRLAKRPPPATRRRLQLRRLRLPCRFRRPCGSAGPASPAGPAGPAGPASTVGPVDTERVPQACASRPATRLPTTASSWSSRTSTCLTSSTSDSSELGPNSPRKLLT